MMSYFPARDKDLIIDSYGSHHHLDSMFLLKLFKIQFSRNSKLVWGLTEFDFNVVSYFIFLVRTSMRVGGWGGGK